MKHSFRELSASGLLEKRDYSAFFGENQNKIKEMTSVLLENVELWLKLEQTQWGTLKGELAEFQSTYGSQAMHLCNMSNIGIESWLARSDQIHNNDLRRKLYQLYEGKLAMLGHFSAGFTLDTYTHVTTVAQKEAAQTMGNILG